MSWNPSTKQLECIAEMAHAKAPVAQIAAAVGLTPEEFCAWCARLAAARALMMIMPEFPPKRAAAKEPDAGASFAEVAALCSKIMANRLFEGDGADILG